MIPQDPVTVSGDTKLTLPDACLERDASLDLHWICAERIEEQREG